MTQMLKPTDLNIAQCADIWRSGGLVAFPTETVYGLGADACNGDAVAAIYAAKARPSFNPLIIHVADITTAQRYAVFSDTALQLAQAHWPGPLSLVLPIKRGCGLSELVTAGLETVAVRIPENPLARQLLGRFGGAVAAPSANPSGAISPTTARHVHAGLSGKIDAIIDGGPCHVGLESTILKVGPDRVHLLRAGGLPLEDIACDVVVSHPRGTEDAPQSPGQLQSHYAPNAQLRMNVTEAHEREYHIGFGAVAGQINLSRSADLREAATKLFAYLRMADEDAATLGKSHIAVAPIPHEGLGMAINDRLKRASAPRG
ncbi:threonylcarbamoyl-AMP synthase [Amylibacter marinus]|uniref:Threonylcarbamoyl-AMP synthase n=1 Tax=Amylibacter marinus TaxID=1475483 RepID=A0ABQ5VXD8_9RHOB|nr:L-threonylcarbamoyladenylate synthase [Amylibacter marinus]GLQ35901.1 threonylcarbamoyl-AMP synthase [Amylibacter marinus]